MLLENVVYLTFIWNLCLGYEVYIGKIENAEIDFAATRQENKLYIQITQQIEKEETAIREYGRLLGIADNYPKYVLHTDEFASSNYQGIKTITLQISC